MIDIAAKVSKLDKKIRNYSTNRNRVKQVNNLFEVNLKGLKPNQKITMKNMINNFIGDRNPTLQELKREKKKLLNVIIKECQNT